MPTKEIVQSGDEIVIWPALSPGESRDTEAGAQPWTAKYVATATDGRVIIDTGEGLRILSDAVGVRGKNGKSLPTVTVRPTYKATYDLSDVRLADVETCMDYIREFASASIDMKTGIVTAVFSGMDGWDVRDAMETISANLSGYVDGVLCVEKPELIS